MIGTGRITRRLVADLQSTEGVQVTCIASRSKERADWFSSQYGIANAVEGYAAMMERDDVDAVYIALPPSMHVDCCIRAAESGKHVLCEKPLTTNAADAIAIDRACQKAGVRWLDATGWLHHGRTQQMLQWHRDGKLGKLGHIAVAVSFYRPFQTGEHRLDPALGGGCVLDLGWYAAGLVRQFAGTPTRIFATSVLESGVPLRSSATMWFEDGMSATLSIGYDTATRKWFEVAGSDASLICDDFTRPWADRATRFWIHDASGKVDAHEFADQQETRMIEKLVGDSSLSHWNADAIATQSILDSWSESSATGQVVDVAPSPQE